MRNLRRAVVLLVIGSFTLAALIGVVTLLAGGFGDTQGRILLTTTVVGVESVAMLCYLSLAGHRLVAVGVAGALTSYVATALALWLTWSEGVLDSTDVLRAWGVAAIVAGTLAQASLLITLTGRPGARRDLNALLWTTLGLAGLLAAMLCGVIVTEQGGYGLAKAIGVVAILDVLGTVVVAALGVFGARGEAPAAAPQAAPALRPAMLAPDVEARLVRSAAAAGLTPSQLVARALDGLSRDAGGSSQA